jgi:tryptophanyl-tRNA synthetase
MSKSAPDPASRILLTDDAATIKSKIRIAVTDSIQGISYDPVERPGTANLLTILAACKEQPVETIAGDYTSKNHGALKADVVEAIEGLLKGPRAEFARIRQEESYLEKVAMEGAERSRAMSGKTMVEVRQRLGLYP